MDHSTHTPLGPAELTESTLVGATIYGADDEKVGTISHLHQSGAVAQAVVDVGGFLGIGSKPVLVSLNELNMMRDHTGSVHGMTSWTKDELKTFPEHRH
ncbi:MAG: PRC-barrel domain-containing protein [Tabrizicola sp.]|uniref:PRC-barrel domain-containing protein n=1 Tax=Tabrizicola sp. TaxID=2005166 RepID=UPI002ABA2C35|nr:PRC-barrel domain-containing protein [Tabrizicola sp.]MDZ4088599.1 PRC-barrel domain-containing protein [Tabrizicola sp.]